MALKVIWSIAFMSIGFFELSALIIIFSCESELTCTNSEPYPPR
jgi:hypothetical protein